MTDLKNLIPSVLLNTFSLTLSGWGINPTTFPFLLVMPAIFNNDPFGFDSFVISPFSLQYEKII